MDATPTNKPPIPRPLLMSTLTAVSGDAMDVIGGMLEPRHLARLYMTGDAALIGRLSAMRDRRYDSPNELEMSRPVSDLVATFLIGRATRVATSIGHLSVASLTATPLRIRELRLRDPYAEYECDCAASACGVNFSALMTLEVLEIGHPYFVASTLTLPPSLMSVDLDDVRCRTPIRQMGDMLSLEEVSFFLNFKDASNHEDFFQSVQWPQSVASLTINFYCKDTSLLQRMPRSLAKFTVVWSMGAEVDLFLLTEHQLRLESLIVKDGIASIRGPLPPTLTSLDIAGLRVSIEDGGRLEEAVHNIPLSVTRFTAGYVRGARREELEHALCPLLPRLTLACQENLLRIIADTGVRLAPDHRLYQVFADATSKHPLGGEYMEAIRADGVVSAFASSISLDRIARLLHRGAPESVIARVICGRSIWDGLYHDDEYHAFETEEYHAFETEAYAPMCIRLLRLGYTHCLNVAMATLEGFGFEANSLPATAVNNLRTLTVSPRCLHGLEALLRHNQLASLECVNVTHKEGEEVETLLKLLCEHRTNTPRVEKIAFCDLSKVDGGRVVLSEGIVASMAERRMYLVRRNRRRYFSYYVERRGGSSLAVSDE